MLDVCGFLVEKAVEVAGTDVIAALYLTSTKQLVD